MLLSARLQLERARVASETLAALGLPTLVLDEKGKVLAANHLIEALAGYVRWRAQDRVSLKDRAADQLLRDAIAAIDLTGGASVRSFPVRDTGAEAMMVAHVIPIRLAARDIFVRCAAALVLTPVTLPQAPPVELVQSLFDLTPAEARVARSLASGETVEAIASARGRARSRRFGKNWLQPASRYRGPSHRDFPSAADKPDLKRRRFRKIAKTLRALSILMRRQSQCSISVPFVRSRADRRDQTMPLSPSAQTPRSRAFELIYSVLSDEQFQKGLFNGVAPATDQHEQPS
jgi:hypothetical protein